MLISADFLGFGAVASAAVRKLKEQNLSVFINACLVRSPEKYDNTYGVHLTSDAEWMLDCEHTTTIVVDCLPGIEPSLTYIKTALDNGSDVITCNKELVNHRGEELCLYAKSKGRTIYFNSIPAAKVPDALNDLNITQDNLLEFEQKDLYSYKEADAEITADYIVKDIIRAIKKASPGSTDLTVCDACLRGEHG